MGGGGERKAKTETTLWFLLRTGYTGFTSSPSPSLLLTLPGAQLAALLTSLSQAGRAPGMAFLKYSATELKKLYSFISPSCLDVIKFLHILRRPRYVHRATRHKFVHSSTTPAVSDAPQPSDAAELCSEFSRFFQEKVDTIYQQLHQTGIPSIPAHQPLDLNSTASVHPPQCSLSSFAALEHNQVMDLPRSLRSSDKDQLATPRTRLRTFGDRAFCVSAPTLWNKLPLHIRHAPTLLSFKKHLKAYLFTEAFGL
ncbi:unnamed protein product [Leuciscus chuanchicus]